MGGARAICSTAGSTVVARPRLLVSILRLGVLVFAADNDGSADDDGRRDDVTVTSSMTSSMTALVVVVVVVVVVVTGFDDVVDFRARLWTRGSGNSFSTAHRKISIKPTCGLYSLSVFCFITSEFITDK